MLRSVGNPSQETVDLDSFSRFLRTLLGDTGREGWSVDDYRREIPLLIEAGEDVPAARLGHEALNLAAAVSCAELSEMREFIMAVDTTRLDF